MLVAPGALASVPSAVPEGALRVLLVHAPPLAAAASSVADALRARGLAVVVEALPDAEAAKTLGECGRLWSVLGQAGFTRTDVVVALGGGATTDLGGFVAAGWLRGVPVVQVPTTLLGMVDAAVGGKTGINTPEGKNLVGAFHEPAAVIADLSLLATLPHADLVAGMAEVIKCGFIADPQILSLVEADPAAALDVTGPALAELVTRAIEVKARVVAADLRESSLREILNYGHTFAHAIEQTSGYRWRHGDAVAVGMVYASELACRARLLDASVVERTRSILTSVGLPIRYDGDASWETLLQVMARDKKTRGAVLRFVALTAVGSPTRLEGPAPEMLRAAFDAVTVRGA
nr:3-dehydroquinate synthase [Metallococcus carri]